MYWTPDISRFKMQKLLRGLKLFKADTATDESGLTPTGQDYLLVKAYVPEHIPSLMGLISGGRPLLIEDHLALIKDNWLIFVGYPLETEFRSERCRSLVEQALEAYRPDYLWFIGPEIPAFLADCCRQRNSDEYYRLDVEHSTPKSSLRRVVKTAAAVLTVEQTRRFAPEHQALVTEFKQRQELPPLVDALYEALPDYLAQSPTAEILNARDGQGRLTAFYVVEPAARAFDTYVLGCYSRTNYVAHASDLLLFEMIELARVRGKRAINLGLGVNGGIRRFKKKWGGQPYLKYEFCECYFGPARSRSVVDLLLEGTL